MDGEAPVNPYSLLEAVNSSSDRTNMSWLIFIGLMIYILIAVAGVSHEDLLLNNEISLPIVQVSVELTQFFLFAPIVLLLVHVGAIMQLVMLAHKTIEFDKAMRLLEVSNKRRHPLRLELHNFFFVQGIAGPHRSRIMGLFLHLMAWLTLVILPVLLLLFIQTSFIPYHSETITWTHRFVLLIDVALLVLIGVFLVRSEPSFFGAFYRSAAQNPLSFLGSTVILLYVIFFSFFVATIPDKPLARFAEKTGLYTHKMVGTGADGAKKTERLRWSDALPLFNRAGLSSIFWDFSRNLVVTGADLVKDKDLSPGERTINLRGRDLTYAILDRTDLQQADLTGADLTYASLVRTDLRYADLQESRLNNAIMVRAKLQGAKLNCRNIDALIIDEDRSKAQCVSAVGANLYKAVLPRANLLGLDLSGADLSSAVMSNVDLSYSIMRGAKMAYVRLEGANLSVGVVMQGVSLEQASLQGANMVGADLQGANLTNASLEGAVLRWSNLNGANLMRADLSGADLIEASLLGANLSNAKLIGADLKGVSVWMTKPPSGNDIKLANLSGLAFAPPDQNAKQVIKALLQSVKGEKTGQRLRDALSPLLRAKASDAWGSDSERQTWDTLVADAALATGGGDPTVTTTYKDLVTAYLANLMCNSRNYPGQVASGILRQAQVPSRFRGNSSIVYSALTTGNCRGRKGVPPDLLREVEASVASGSP